MEFEPGDSCGFGIHRISSGIVGRERVDEGGPRI